MILGLTGGIASGKSTVSNFIEKILKKHYNKRIGYFCRRKK